MERYDETGNVYGRWTVLGLSHVKGYAFWHCRCECGEKRIVGICSLKTGRSKSCGCWNRERSRERATTHGLSRTPEHLVWQHIRQRCRNTNNSGYHNYGGRGIKVCKRWDKSFVAFLADMGKRPSPKHTIERINNDGHYEPGNCKWATRKENNNNRRKRRWQKMPESYKKQHLKKTGV